MAHRAIKRDDDHDDRTSTPSSERAEPTPVRPVVALTLEQELALIDAAIDEEWERMEPSMRYLADR